MLRSTKCLFKRIVDPRFSLTARRLRQRINTGTARVVPRGRLNLASTWMSHTVTAARLPSNRWREMPDTVHSLSTAGLGPKRQIQYWSDALTDLCGQFSVDPLEASTLEARINFTTVSTLKLCQIESKSAAERAPQPAEPQQRTSLRQDSVPDLRHLVFRAEWLPDSDQA